jgi:hypothetical protein
LVISENIVKAFDGGIGVRSKFGKGTTFVFSIVLNNYVAPPLQKISVEENGDKASHFRNRQMSLSQ